MTASGEIIEKLQAPTSKLHPDLDRDKHQTSKKVFAPAWCLAFGASLVLGAWNLDVSFQRSNNMNVTSASLTVSPSTEQTPLALPILPRDFTNSTSMVNVSPGRTGFRQRTLSAD